MSADRSGQRLRRPGSTAATSMELRPAPRDGTAEPAVMAIHRSGMVADAEGTEYPIRPMSILEGEGRAIHDFMVGRGYSQSLETGMAYGVSTLWLADAVARVDGGHHIAIDPRQVSGYHSIGPGSTTLSRPTSRYRSTGCPSWPVPRPSSTSPSSTDDTSSTRR